MKITLISHTENPDELCSRIAQVCYSDKKFEDIKPNTKLLRDIIDSGHESVIEHATFTFSIEGVSRVVSHQLVRHRMASYSQQSLRYVHLDDINVLLPDSIADLIDNDPQFASAMDSANIAQSKVVDILIEKNIPDEDIRYIHPMGITTNLIVSMNARELLHFFKLRCCNRAQKEIRLMAEIMLKQCRSVAPIIFEKAGKPCLFGECPEGTRSCKIGKS